MPDQDKVQIILEVIDTGGPAALEQARQGLNNLNQAQAALAKTTAATQQAAAANNASLVATGAAAKAVAGQQAVLNSHIQTTKQSMAAMRGVVTMMGMQAFPQLSGAIAVTSASLDILNAKSALTTASLARLGVIGAVLAGTALATTKSFEKLWASQISDNAETAAIQQSALIRHIKRLGEEGALSEQQISKLMRALTADPSLAGLKKVREEIQAIAKTRLPVGEIERMTASLRRAQHTEALGVSNADLMKPRMATIAYNESLIGQRNALRDISVEYIHQQQALQQRLNLSDELASKNKEWLELEAKSMEAADQAVVIDRRRRDAIRETQAQQLQGTRDMFANMATAAQAFGAEGFVAYKVFASTAAIVDTYRSATAAYAAMAGIPYVGPALAVAAAAAAIAAGLANVAAINSQSFDVGGYTGDGGRLEPAGVVHRGEYVFSQSDVARIGLENIAAFRFAPMPAPPQLPRYSGTFADGGLVGQASSHNLNFALIDNRQDRREWEARKGMKVLLGELKRRGNKVSV